MLILSRAIFFLFQKVMGLTVGWEFIYKLAEGFGIAREIKIFIFFYFDFLKIQNLDFLVNVTPRVDRGFLEKNQPIWFGRL